MKWIVEAETLEDMLNDNYSPARQLIECKDCKHYKTMFCAIDTWTEDVTIYKARPDDFCSYAERREE